MNGVFPGMQAASWNQEREARSKAAIFTIRLHKDLRYKSCSHGSSGFVAPENHGADRKSRIWVSLCARAIHASLVRPDQPILQERSHEYRQHPGSQDPSVASG